MTRKSRWRIIWLLVVLATLSVVLALLPPPQYATAVNPNAAESAEDKLIILHNRLAQIPGLESSHKSTDETFAPFDVTFTSQELNAAIAKWTQIAGIDTPGEIGFSGHDVVLSRRIGPTVGSIRLTPYLDSFGKLHLEQNGASVGWLPVPSFILPREKFVALIEQELPKWRQHAVIKSNGRCNLDAAKAVGGLMAIHALRDEPIEPEMILPLDNQKGIAVRIDEVNVTQRGIALKLQPLNAQQRAALAAQIKNH